MSTDKVFISFEGSTTPHFLSMFTPEFRDELKKPKHLIELPISVNIESEQTSEKIVSEVQEDFS